MHRLFVALVFALAASMPAMAAQTCDCETDCADRADPTAGLSFDDKAHRLWYADRFWRGECPASLFWCFSGDDWYNLMQEQLARTPAADRGVACARLFALGVRIGHEWARDNDVRKISTDDLEAWQGILRDPERPAAAALAETERLAAEAMRRAK